MFDKLQLNGKTAIVTGGTKGIGKGIVEGLAQSGANVVVVSRHQDECDAVAKEMEKYGVKGLGVKTDVTVAAEVAQLMEKTIAAFGRIDILVNNAGASAFHDFDDYPDKYWEMCINLDFNAVYYLSKEVAHIMKAKGGGKIINIGSALSYTSDAKCPPYTAAKHGVIGITRNFANELGRFNIQTNAICPGFLATEVNAELRKDPAFYNKITNRIAAGRWGELDDLMGTMVFLASRASDYLNGVDINVDGGFFTVL